MNIRGILIIVSLAVVSGGLMVHFRQQSLIVSDEEKRPTEDGIPKPPSSGPYGKFEVVGKTVHNFGVLELGQKGSHEFKIRNDGPGPLKLVARKEDHTCQCTLGSLGSEGLKPGEESTVTLNWEIKNPQTRFEHSAKIRTDDPDRPVTTFRVLGMVGKRLAVKSGIQMNVGTLSETTPTERKFVLHSETIDDFEITKIEVTNPLVDVSFRPLKGTELEEAAKDPAEQQQMRMMAESKKAEMEAKDRAKEETKHDHILETDPEDDLAGKSPPVKSGHEIRVAFKHGFPIGKFRESVTIHTNIPDTPPVAVVFEGTRSGPIEILGTPGSGWLPEQSLIRMGRFRAKESRKIRLMVFVKKAEMPLVITKADLSPPFLKYELIKDENFKQTARDRYDLIIEVPAGQAPISLAGESIGSIVLHTNHPEAKLILLGLEFTSF